MDETKKGTYQHQKQRRKMLQILYSIRVYGKISKHHSEEMLHYNKLKGDILNWDGVNFPTGNRDIE